MKLFIQLFSIIAVLASPTYCQKEDYVWIFGDSTGIDFKPNGEASAIVSNISGQYENYASISNSHGELLFYIHGGDYLFEGMYSNIRNKNEDVIDNGDSILSHWTTNQSVMILSFPSDTMSYFVVHISESSFFPQHSGFYYSLIKRDTLNLEGKVTSKNQMLVDSAVAERLHAVRHANGEDWLVFVHSQLSNKFIGYNLSSEGIQSQFSQNIGAEFINHCSWVGEMNFSPNGKKLVVLGFNGLLDLYDVNRCTGVLMNWNSINPGGDCNLNTFY